MNIKKKLEYHYKKFDISTISPDPLEFLHRFNDPLNIEISGLISSIYAYGNVNMIIRVLNQIHDIMGDNPYEFLKSFDIEQFESEKVEYRFYNHQDFIALLRTLKIVYEEYGSLRYLFLLYYFADDKNIKNALSFFSNNLLNIAQKYNADSNGLKFMFPDSLKGSTCKRMNLFLRWMVRNDELDFGIWKDISADKLVIPVDTHIAKICSHLGLTTKKNVSWSMAEEITDNLKKYCPNDPVKYDFALCHIGMRNLDF
ncbi:MAG: TIGR02757 family protein [Melioribacteraceae bacterium]|nr:TIGR02757 family protein [Melioribacteraceae bacterium]